MLCEQNKEMTVKINVPKALHKLHLKSRFLRQPNRMSKLNQKVSGCMLDISTLKRSHPNFNTQKMYYVMPPWNMVPSESFIICYYKSGSELTLKVNAGVQIRNS